jgi:hypothetical protein
MLRVTVELLPQGDETKAEHLGTATIANDGTGTIEFGNYVARFSKWGQPNDIWKKGTVRNFPRKGRGPWDLLYLALRDAVGSRNNGR